MGMIVDSTRVSEYNRRVPFQFTACFFVEAFLLFNSSSSSTIHNIINNNTAILGLVVVLGKLNQMAKMCTSSIQRSTV